MPADEKVIGGPVGVPLAASPSVIPDPGPQLLPADTASGARFGLDDDAPLAPVGEVPVERVEPAEWAPPSPRTALDPRTAPYEDLRRADLRREGSDEPEQT